MGPIHLRIVLASAAASLFLCGAAQASLLGLYTFNGNALDSSGNGNNGTVHGNVSYSLMTPWGAQALTLPGGTTRNDYVSVKPYGVAVVSLYPGLVRTEKIMEAAPFLDLSNSESPEFIGRAVAALAADPDVLRYSGEVLVAAAVAMEYGFTDIDGKRPRPLTADDV